MLKKSLTTITAGALFAGLSASAIVVYEGFDYSGTETFPGDPEFDGTRLDGNGGDNWGSAWDTDSNKTIDDQFYVGSPGLTDPDLGGVGGLAGRLKDTSDRGWAVRTVSSAAQTDLTGGSEMWFSFLYDSSGSEDFAFLFGDFGDLADGGNDPALATADNAFGFSSIGNSFAATVFDSSPTGSLGTGTDSQDLGTEDSVFIIGKITWAADGTNDRLDLYNPGNSTTDEGSLVSFSHVEADLDQSGFNNVGLWDRPNSVGRIDEIRLSNSYADVSAVPEPSAFALLVGMLGLTWVMLRRRG